MEAQKGPGRHTVASWPRRASVTPPVIVIVGRGERNFQLLAGVANQVARARAVGVFAERPQGRPLVAGATTGISDLPAIFRGRFA